MKNESKRELAAAKETLASLEAPSADTASDAETFQLGQLLRESSATDLPAADPALRKQLMAALETLPGLNELAKEEKHTKQTHIPTNRRRKRNLAFFATASAVVFALGGTFFVIVSNDYFKSSRQRSTAELRPANYATQKEELLSTESVSRTMQSAELESRLQTAPYEWMEQSIGESVPASEPAKPPLSEDEFSLPGQQLQSQQGGGESLADTSISQGTIEAYPANLSLIVGSDSGTVPNFGVTSTTKSTAISVPDGGTVLSGGIKITAEGKGIVFPDPDEWNSKRLKRQKFLAIREPDMIVKMGAHTERVFSDRAGEAGTRISGEQYDPIVENSFIETVGQQALSTFSIDVDTASYSNMRRFINSGQLPPPNSVRIEELVNYFQYDYPQPEDGKPFRIAMEVAECPWQPEHRLVRIGIKGKDVHRNERPASNLVFLLDVSGSMKDADKLPLLQRGLQTMLDRLNENDRVSIVTYASNAGVRLKPTSGDQKIKIRDVIDGLSADGSTNGSAGIEIAYDLAAKNFIKEGTNRVILATDGDLNVGVTDDESLVKMIKAKASEGVFLTVLGFGTGNLKDSKMEKLADNGNGVYAYIDSMREAHKVLVEQMSGSLVTIAKDVKLQVEFNPAEVKAYRLLGYENRKMANADFANDKKDAGEIGAGHTVTALYEIVPAGTVQAQTLSANLKYQKVEQEKPQEKKPLPKAAKSGELLTLAIRYKLPDASESEKIEFTLADSKKKFYEASGDFRFAAAVASFGMLLRNSQFSGNMDLEKVENIASMAIGEDPSGYRIEFVDLVRQLTNATEK